MLQSECMGCVKRYPGCHSVCESYKAYKARIAKMKENSQMDADPYIKRPKRSDLFRSQK